MIFIGPLEACKRTHENIDGFPHNTDNVACAQRMKKDNEIYHSSSYVRKKTSVSFLVRIKADTEDYFGKVEYFVKQGNDGFAVIKVYHNLQYNICQRGLPEPNDPVVKEFLTSHRLGCHFIAVERTEQLKFINCSHIISRVIYVESINDDCSGFVSSVLKCYQHD